MWTDAAGDLEEEDNVRFYLFYFMFFVTILMSMDSTPPLKEELMTDGLDV